MSPAAPRSQVPARAPAAPVSAPLSDKAVAEYQALKRSLNELASWELSGSGFDTLPMMFTEGGNEQQARALAQALQ